MFHVPRLVSPGWFLGIAGVWIASTLAMGLLVSVSEAEPSYYNVIDNSYTLSLLGAVFSVVAHRHFEMSLALGAWVFNSAAFVSVIGGARIAIAEMKDCRNLYDDDLAYGQLTAAQASQYRTGTSTISVAALGNIIANHNIVTYGTQCLGIEFTGNSEYYAHYTLLVIVCLATTVCSTALTVLLLLHVPGIREHAEKLAHMAEHLVELTFSGAKHAIKHAEQVVDSRHKRSN
jgi:hypothetical protein